MVALLNPNELEFEKKNKDSGYYQAIAMTPRERANLYQNALMIAGI